jgi:hypothetical protein
LDRIIDTDYHSRSAMTRSKSKARGSPDALNPTWSFSTNPAVVDLLDHIAEELAREYVRLMKKAAQEEADVDGEPRRQEE